MGNGVEVVSAEVIPSSKSVRCYRKGIKKRIHSVRRAGALRVRFQDGDIVVVPLTSSIGGSSSDQVFESAIDIPANLRRYVERAARKKSRADKQQKGGASGPRKGTDESKKQSGGAPTRTSNFIAREVK